MHFLSQYGLFALESLTLVIAILLLVAGVLSLGRKPKNKDTVQIQSLDEHRDDIKHHIQKEITGKKPEKKKKDKTTPPSCFVLNFKGDIMASQVEQLRHEVSALLSVATEKDNVVVRLHSPGGSVNGYGLAAAQLQRIRDKNIPLTVCIDQIAASGGYLMACVANRIVAAPFSIIGSIGVVAQLPNFHRLLKKNNIDVELLTAGEYKRTLTVFGENTESGRKKFQQDLEKIHTIFRNYILTNRKQVDIEKVATGEHWLAIDAFGLGLVDVLQTSDDYLDEQRETYKTYELTLYVKQPLSAKLLKPFMHLFHAWS